jgi:hypothetical protein
MTTNQKHLYMIESMGFYKIGHSCDLKNRLAELSTGNPLPITLISVGLCIDLEEIDNSARLAEKIWHKHLKVFRRSGEWFALPKQLAEIVSDMIEGDELPILGDKDYDPLLQWQNNEHART